METSQPNLRLHSFERLQLSPHFLGEITTARPRKDIEIAMVNEEPAVTKKTKNGSEFTKVSEAELKALGIKDPLKFGESWQDPTGAIWSDVAKKDDGSWFFMNQKDAEDYCKSLGAELPSGYPERQNGKNGFPANDSDFVRLGKYMGEKAGSREGYTAQILPHLSGSVTFGNQHWSSSIYPNDARCKDDKCAYYYGGDDGGIFIGGRQHVTNFFVRCVVRSQKKNEKM